VLLLFLGTALGQFGYELGCNFQPPDNHNLNFFLLFLSNLIRFNTNNFSFANVLTPPSVHHLVHVVSFSQIFLKGLVTQFIMSLNASNNAKLDHLSGTR
jgi:hypothetical protein